MLHTAMQDTPVAQVAYMPGLFQETLKLLEDAHAYFSYFSQHDQQHSNPVEKLIYSSEMSRITLRLSSVMSWLMARRAEASGQISREEAVDQFRLAFPKICMHEQPDVKYILPQAMCQLLDSSLSLYRRASRLDDMLAGATVH